MKPRIEYQKVAPDAMSAILGLEKYVRQSGLDASLLELVKLRISQLNGGPDGIDMHTKDGGAEGESEQGMYSVPVWRETPFLNRERAALAWTEAITERSLKHVPQGVYEFARCLFSEKELVGLTLAIIAINGWNRLAISFRTMPGTYQPSSESTKAAATSRTAAAGPTQAQG